MKWIADTRTLELTARNIAALTAKLDDPQSARTLVSGCGGVCARAVEVASVAETVAAGVEGVVTLSRAHLVDLATEGAIVTVADVSVVSVPDARHYSNRPSGAVVMPTSQEFLEPDTTHWRLHHICEVCGKDEILTASEAFDAGWDYPPRVGVFGVVGPRTCGGCSMEDTLWWALAVDGVTTDSFTDSQWATIARIQGEPESIAVRRSE